MKKRFSKLLVALFICVLGAIMIATSAITAFAADTNEVAAVAEEEITAALTDSGVCGTNATWEYYAEIGTLRISGSGAMNSYSNGSAPWYTYRSKITKVVVVDSITTISKGAFYGLSSLKEVSLPFVGESRTATGPNATFGYIFGYTTTTAYNPYNSNSTYYKGIFAGNSDSFVGYMSEKYSDDSSHYAGRYDVSSVAYSDLGWNSYGSASQSTSFLDYKVGNNTGSSNYKTFAAPSGTTWQYSCNDYNYYSSYGTLQSYYYYIPASITKVTITDATKIETAAFMNCSNITEINLNSEITKISEYAFRECTKLDTFALPNDLTSLGSYAMYNCDSLTTIEIPNGTKTISSYAFYDCDALTNVEFHNNVNTISSYAFYSCGALKNIDLSENLVTISDGAFQSCSSFTKIVIPDKVTTIGGSAFRGCSKVESIIVGESVTTIGSYAFSGCTNTLSISFGKSVKTISSYAFSNLSKIQTIIVPNNVTSIGTGAFKGTSSLKEISLPFVGESRIATGPNATFGYIFGYTTTTAYNPYNSNSTYYKGIFAGNSDSFVGYMSEKYSDDSSHYAGRYDVSSVAYSDLGWNSYGSASQSTSFLDYKVGNNTGSSNYKTFAAPSGTTWQYSCNDYNYYSSYGTLQSYYYYIPASITKVTITDATKIETAAFMNCTNIAEINLNTEIESVSDYAFRNFGAITKSTDALVISGDILLSYKGTDKNVVIPENIKIIAPRAFYGKSSLTSVTFADKTGFVGAYAFYNCSNMTVYVPRISGALTIKTSGFSGTGSVTYLDKSSYTNGNDTFYYNVDENGNAVIVDCTTTSANITLPVTLGGYTVTTVGYKGMANCTTLKSVTIPSNIVKLDLYAFYGCTGLDTATIPATCVYVGEYAFAGCTSMTSVVIAEGVTYLGNNCFENCTSLTEIVVPDSCIYLGEYALYNCVSLESATIGITVPAIHKYTFYNCESLKTVVIGIKVESIGEYAFYNCALERVSAPNTLKSIGNYAFAENEALTRVALKSGVESIGNGAFYGDSLLSTINLPTTIETIGAYAFYDCAALTSVTIPVLVEVINDYTFTNCTALTTLKINAETVTIGDKAFAYCSALNSVTLSSKVTSIGEKAFYRNALATFNFTDGLTYVGADAFAFTPLTAVTLPNSVTYIGEQAFVNCAQLSNISIPDSVTYVGAYAFEGNTADLQITIRYNSGKVTNYLLYNTDVYKVVMEDGITQIGNYAFAYCHNLSEIVFSNTLESIGSYAFYDNRSYSELTLPNTVTSIGSYAFARGYQFVKINIPDSVLTIGSNAFYREEAENHIDPEFTVEFYYNKGVIAANILDGQHIHHIIVDDYIHTVGDNAFSNCANLQDVILPDTIAVFGNNCFLNDNSITVDIDKVDGLVDNEIYREKLSGVGTVKVTNTNIGEYAFYGNTTIQTVITTDVDTIFDYAFSHNSALQKVEIVGDTDISKYAFSDLAKLQYVNITGNTDIGDYAFSNDIALLKTVVTGSSNVGNYSFYNCNSMTDFVIDGTIVRIGEHAFDGCKALKAMALPTTVNYIGSYAFYDCNSMKSINIPNGIEKILSHTFYGCASLGSIEVPNSVIAIEDYAFYGCVVATDITLSNQCKTIGEAAFYNCKALTELNIPDSVTSIGAYAFRSCGAITELVFSDNVDQIGACAFYDCNGLKTVKLGKKIIELGDRLFYGCVNLESLYVYAPLSYIDTLAFYGADYVTVYCGRDDYMINFFDENGIMYVILDDLVYEYKITFVTDNGEIISSATYTSGSTVTPPANPTKSADNTYTYVFAGWDQDITIVGGNKTYTASFTPVYIEYTVVFKDYNGDTLSSETYHYGDAVTAPSNPTRAADNTYTYAFAGWDNEVVACAGDATYTATYIPTFIEYTVVFKDYNGTILGSATLHYGDVVTAPADPTRAADLVGTYSFAGWDNEVVACAGNAEYTATYDISYIDYTVVFKDYNGNVISTETYHYGDTVAVPSDPTRAADNTYTYAFAGWDMNVATTCDGNKEYTATYTPTFIDYTVVFKDYNGNVISTKTYHYGDTVVVPSDPTREADNTYTYAFAGWDTSVATTCDGNKEYTATYTPTFIDYTVVFKDYNGTVLSTETYHYGETVTAPADPTREADVVGSYTFKAWDAEVVACAGNATYTATYDVSYTDYTVVFKNYNGDVLSTNTYHYGDTVVVPSAPSKPADETYTYAFIGWDMTVTTCEGDATYTAKFAPTNVEYTVVFKNADGTVLSTKTYYYGAEVAIPKTPTKASDNTYTYTFAGWDKEVVDCVADATYIATYTPVYINYTITFTDYDGRTITTVTYHYGDTIESIANPTRASDETYTYTFNGWDKELGTCKGDATFKATYTSTYIDYTIIFKNEDGTVLSRNTYHYGDAVTIPATPTKAADNTYAYTFKGWDQEVVNCAGNATYTATYNANYIDYTVIFKNADGTVLSTKTYHYGVSVIAPKTPTKAADTTYTYTFKGWDKEVVDCVGNATYTATYDANYINYTVIFKNADGTVLSTNTYHYGDAVTAPEAPTKAADNTYTYTFKAWDKTVVNCAGNATYTATYNATYIDYTVTFKNEDGSILSSDTYHYGESVVAPSTPSKAANNTYTYTFAGWDSEVVACNGNKTYTATYTPVYIEYTVVFKNWNGDVISSNVYTYGQTVTKPSDPTKAADTTYTYAFMGWDKTVTNCTESVVYTATYSSTYIDYEIVFKNYDGSILSSETYHYGDAVVVPEMPTKPADESYTYGFAGWDSEVTACSGNKTYTATFNPTNVEYTVVFKDYNGNVISSEIYHFGDEIVVPEAPSRNADNTYTYTFKNWGKTVAENCVGDAEYTAVYEATYIEYNIKFLDWDGSVIQTVKYHYGDTITAIADPERASDETYTYTFLSWNKALGTCTGNASFTAQYESTFINYTVVFKDYDGSVISRKAYHFGDPITIPADPIRVSDDTYSYTFKNWGNISTSCNGNKEYTANYDAIYIDYTVVFKNHDGSVISTQTYHFGDDVTVPQNPTKTADNTYTYTFAGWDKEIVDCVANATYTASYTPTFIDYTVVFKDSDGSVLSTKTYHYGDAVSAPEAPTKGADDNYTYTFKAWDKEVVACVGDAVYTAVYTSTKIEGNDSTETPTTDNTTDKSDFGENKSDENKVTETDAKSNSGCGGCGSSTALSALAIVAVVGSALVIKKKED